MRAYYFFDKCFLVPFFYLVLHKRFCILGIWTLITCICLCEKEVKYYTSIDKNFSN